MNKILVLLITLCMFCFTNTFAQQSRGQKMLIKARQGSVPSMRVVARCYNSGIEGLPKNKNKALFWARKAAQNGDLLSMYYITLWIDDVEEKGEDSEKLYWALKGANRSDSQLQVVAAQVYQRLGILMTYSKDQQTYVYKYSNDKRKFFFEEAITWATKARDSWFSNSSITREAQYLIKLASGPMGLESLNEN